MKKIYLLIIALFCAASSFGQVSAYTFSQSTGTYTPITGGTLIVGATNDDGTFGAQNIGFTFTYNGVAYTQFGVNTNGWVSLGAAVPVNSYNPISGGTTNNIISAIGQDLQLGFVATGDITSGSNTIINMSSTTGYVVGDIINNANFPAGTSITSIGAGTITVSNNATANATTSNVIVAGQIRVETIGVSPSQICVIQWYRARKFGNFGGANDFFNYQIRLHETTNVVEIMYGPFFVNATAGTVETGLRGANNADFNNRTTGTDWNTTATGAVNTANNTLSSTVFPANGLSFMWTPPSACVGTPSAGTASGPANACTGVNFNLVLSGYTAGPGITLQWQSSPDNITFTNIPGATNATAVVSQTAISYYQCIVTCTNSGMSATSNVVTVGMNTFINCYCIPTSTNGTGFGDYISEVHLDTINNLTGGAPNPYYTVYTSPSTTLSTGQTYTITMVPGTYTSNDLAAWIDYNQDGIFDNTTEKLGETFNIGSAPTTASFTFTVPLSATAGLTALRVREADQGSFTMDPCVNYGFGETEDYRVNIYIPPVCSGTPNAGIAAGPSDVCSGDNYTVTLAGQTTDLGTTIQWQSSTDGITFANIPGATTSTYAATQTDTMYYQAIVTCTNSGLSATSNIVTVNMSAFYLCYCASEANNIFDTKIDSLYFNTIVTGSPASTCETYTDYTPMSTTLLVNVPYTMTIRNGSCSGFHYDAYAGVYIDYDHDGTFSGAELVASYGPTTGLNTIPPLGITVPVSALTGTTGLRIVFAEGGAVTGACDPYFYGETEDYLVNIMLPPPCAGTPTAGVATGPSDVCIDEPFNVNLTGYTTDLGTTFQWQSSPDGITFSNMPGDTTAVLSTSQTDTTYYQCVITCTNSGLSSTSSVLTVNMTPFLDCYCDDSYPQYTFDTKIDSVFINAVITGSMPSTCETYTDYTPLAPDVQIGIADTIRIRNGSCSGFHYGAYVGVYIDYNQDGDFIDANELAASYGPTTGLNTIPLLPFTPPVGAQVGLTGMRIVFSEGGAVMPPCGGYFYGETEDYYVNLLAPLPCTNPAEGGTISGPAVDSIMNVAQYVTTGSNGTLQWYIGTSATGPFTAIPGATNDTLNYMQNVAGDAYFIVIANTNFCFADTASFYTLVMFPGDDVCDPIALSFGTNGPFNNTGATVEPNEVAPPATGCQMNNGWCNSNLEATMWFTFVAPPSGRVIVHSPSYDTQLAVWDMDTCTDAFNGNAVLVAANDDDPQAAAHGGVTFSSYVRANCLTPGKTYFVQFDAYFTPDSSSIHLSDPGFVDTTFTGLDSVYCDANTNVTLVPAQPNGVFTGGNVTGTTFNPSLATAGTHTITYTLLGCYSSSQTTNVYVTPVANLGADINACGPSMLDAGNATGSNSYTWNTGETTQAINVYDTTGTFIVTINSLGGCSDADTINVTSLAAPVVDLGPDSTICINDYMLDAMNPGSTYLWSTGDVTQQLFLSAPSSATYSVVVTNPTTLCTDEDSITLVLNPTVNAPNIADSVICSGNSILLSAGSGYAGYYWTDGQLSSTNQMITVSPGVQTTYVLTVNNVFGCTDTDTVVVGVEQSPNAAFGSSTAGLNVVTFSNVSTPSTGVTYTWDFGDGSATSTTMNPTHTYGANGAYNVTLIVTNECGTDSTSITIFIDGITVTEIKGGELFVYPNPTNGNVTIINPFGNATLTMHNTAGQLLHTQTLTQKTNNLNYSELPTGIYMMSLVTEQGVHQTRLVITR